MTTQTRTRWQTAALALGFAALAVAVRLAYGHPAQSYELSIYEATPTATWVLMAVALVVALVTSVSAVDRLRSGVAILLAALTVFVVAALPLVRGYEFYGPGDALTHLGWARDMARGVLDPLQLFYPGVHLTGLLTGELLGVPLERALMLVVLVFFAVFLVFVPLTVRQLSGRPHAAAIGAFSALLLLPINNVATHSVVHPSSQAILFVPLVAFLLVKYVTTTDRESGMPVSSTGALLALSVTALVFIHPQQALGIIFVFAAIAAFQAVSRRWGDHDAVSSHRPLYAQTAFATIVFLAWAPRHERVVVAVEGLVGSLLTAPSAAAPEVSQRAVSLLQVGGSITELFVKLFLVGAVYALLTALVAGGTFTGRLRLDPDRDALVRYLSVGLVPLVALFALFFLASAGDHYFRTLGLVMAFATILGAVGLTELVPRLRGGTGTGPRRTVGVLVVVFFLLVTPLALATVHASPFIYQPSSQVSDGEYVGYRTAFQTRDTDLAFTGIRSGPGRYVDAVYGTTTRTADTFPGADSAVPPEVFAANLSTYYDDRRYLPVTDADVEREVTLYRGFRYSERGFERLDTTPGIDRVESNGEFRLYMVGNRTAT